MNIFLTTTSFLRSHGGPAFSVSRLASGLADAGMTVGVWAADGSAIDTPFLSDHPSIRRFNGSAVAALASFGTPAIVHDNGIWLPYHHKVATATARRRIPRVVSSRGMLEPWSLNYKKWKKKVAWAVYQRRDLETAACHHATSELEAQNIDRLGLRVPIRMVPNGIDIPPAGLSEADAAEARRLQAARKIALFVARIHPKKGLPMLVEAWARVRPAGWALLIAGPDEGGHRAEVEQQVHQAGLNDVVSFIGTIDDLQKPAVFGAASLFILPTHSENFGMSIAEALAYGVPVLTTKGAPWEMLPRQRCGWWVDATAEGIAAGLSQAVSCGAEELRSMGTRGRELVQAQFGWDRVCSQIIALYESVLVRP